MEDLPVGGGSGNKQFMDEQPPSAPSGGNADADKPLEERLVSKAWLTRAEAFQELGSKFKAAKPNCADDTFREHSTNWAKFLADINPGALEKALDCFAAYLDKVQPALLGDTQITCFKPLVEKCLGHAKPAIKGKALENFLLIFEVSEKFDEDTTDAIEALCKHKVIKVLTSAIGLLSSLIAAYGVKKIPIQKFAPVILSAANSSNPAARTEAMNCYKSLYLWLKEATDTFTDTLKQQQKDQLKKDYEELKGKPNEKKRLTRSEKEKQKEAALDELIAEEEKEEDKIDVYDLAAPQEILKQFSQEWIDETLAMKKWDDKKARLFELSKAADVPKLKDGDYINLVAGVVKCAKETNVNISMGGIKAFGSLAKGLRDKFATFGKENISILFQKFKERRLVEDIHVALQNILLGIPIQELMESIQTGLKDKAPAIKLNVAIFVEKTVLVTYIDTLEEIQSELCAAAKAVGDEKDNNVREQGLRLLGTLQGRLGEQVLSKYTEGLIPQKKAKVEETAKEVKPSKYDKSQKKAAAAEAAKKRAEAADKKKAAAAPPKKKMAPKEEIKDDGGDDEMMDNFAPPKKAVAKKPALGAKPKGPPTLSSAKTAPKAGGSGKGPSAPKIVEEDLGSGLEKAEAIEKAKEFYSEEHTSKFEEAKWQVKQEGFKGIQAQIEELKPEPVILEATAKFVKAYMKDWKESNINLMKEALATLKSMTTCDRVPKRAVHAYSTFLCDKIGDIKMTKIVKELLMDLSDFVTPKFIALFIIKNGSTAKAIKNIEESCNVLKDMIDEYGAAMMPVKECIEFATLAANNANVKVRNASMQLFAMLYKHLGETVRNFLSDIKDSTMKLIEAEFGKVTPLAKGEFQSTREVKGDAAEELAAAGPGVSLEDSLPREDISKQLNPKLLALFKDKDWKKRKEGATTVEEILRGAKMRIMPDGVGEVMDALKNGMKDPNKAVVKAFILLLGLMAEAMGEAIKIYGKKCLLHCIQNNLSDKNTLVRADTVSTMDKWVDAIGTEKVINYLCMALTVENPELRSEGFTWLANKEKFIPDCDHSVMVKPLVACLSDKTSKIRVAAEEQIVLVMKETGFNPFREAITDLKPAVQKTVRPMLDKAKAKVGSAAPANDEEMEEAKPAPAAKAKSGPTTKSNLPPKIGARQPAAEAPKNSFAAAAKRVPLGQAPATKAAVEEEELNVNPGNKEKRAIVDNKSKWMHEELKPDQVEKVRKICEDMFGFEFMKTKMFSPDFKKHVQVLETLQGFITSQPQVLIECIDVIFKWCYIKLMESNNTTLAMKVFEFFQALFDFLAENDYTLWDHEAYVLVPLLCDKSGLNNHVLKEKVKILIKQCFEMYDPKKCLGLVIKFGAGSKNLKSVAESLDEMCIFMKANGLDYLTEKDLKFVAKLADSGDKGVREGALSVLAEAYKAIDEDIWRVVGNVTVKAKGLLEGRFRKIKGLGASSSTANLVVPQTSRAVAQPSPMSKGRATIGGSNLTKSLVGGGPKAITPRNTTLNFQKGGVQGGIASRMNTSGTANTMNRSIGGANKFTSSINSNNQGHSPNIGLGQRPQTAIVGDKGTRDSSSGLKNRSSLGQSLGQFGKKAPVQAFREPSHEENLRQRQSMVEQASPNELQEDMQEQDSRFTLAQQQNMGNDDQMFVDDDEDLREQIDQLNLQKEEVLDPATKEQMDTIMKHIQSLKYGDLSKRVDSLVALNEIISDIQNFKSGMAKCANDLANAFTHVLVDIFERHLQEIPLRFAKYFVTIVNKATTCKEIMQEVDYNHVYDLAEQLLTRLLIENLDKIGENKEGEMILKNLNASMLRLLENCNPTHIFCVLFNLLRKYKDFTVLPKLPGLIIKCLLKLSKILEKLIDQLNIERILLVIHEYLVCINHEKKTANDEMGIRIVKTVVNEVVKIERENIWEAYKVVECHGKKDNDIQRWITIILRSFNSTQATMPVQSAAAPAQNPSQQQAIDREMKSIIDELRSTDQFEGAIPKLHNLLQRNPDVSLQHYLKDLSAHFANFIRTHLEAFQKSLAETGSTPDGSNIAGNKVLVNNWTAQSSMMQKAKTEQARSQLAHPVHPNTPALGKQSSNVTESQPQDMPTPSQSVAQTPSAGQNRFQARTSNASSFKSANRFGTGVASAQSSAAKPQTAATGLRFPQTSRNMPSAGAGSTGGLSKNDNFGTSSDRINQYQSKLSSMREKFQSRKTGAGPGITPQTPASQPTSKLKAPVAPSSTGVTGGAQESGQKQNLGASFSAMNSSITKKWNMISNKNAGLAKDQHQMSSTMIGGGRQTQVPMGSENRSSLVGGSNLTKSQSNNQNAGEAEDAGASNNDLNERLNQLKAKFQAYKKS